MFCQTQSTIILLAEKHSTFSLLQFTHCHFTGMMSQAGDASSPLFSALLLCLGMTWAAPGCPSRRAVPQGTASWGCVRESPPWSLLMALASCMPEQVLYLCPPAPWHGAGSGLGVVVTTPGCSGDAAGTGAPQAKPEPSRQPRLLLLFLGLWIFPAPTLLFLVLP